MQKSKIKNSIKNSKIKKETIIKRLKTVMDPELDINIVDLGLIYDVKIKENNVRIKMTLTTPGCPLLPHFEAEVKKAVKKIKEFKNVTIDLTFNPVWGPEKMTEEARAQMGM